MPPKSIVKILKKHHKDLSLQGARSLAIFGSFARNENTSKSDMDILTDFDSKKGLFAFIGLKNYLKKILQNEVDLVTKKALHPALKLKIL